MRPGCVKVETKGSFWWFHEDTKTYMRMPKEEKPRERPEWSDERAGILQDAVWHDYVSWLLQPTLGIEDVLMMDALGKLPEGHKPSGPPKLVIFTPHDDDPDLVMVATAPDAHIVNDSH